MPCYKYVYTSQFFLNLLYHTSTFNVTVELELNFENSKLNPYITTVFTYFMFGNTYCKWPFTATAY